MRHAACPVVLLSLATLFGCAKPPVARDEPAPAPVTVAAAVKKSVPVRVRTIGTVKTVASVAVRPRVDGELTGVYFQEGDVVSAGQKLFTIDPRPYDAAVQQAEANLARSLAVLKGAEADLRRAESARNSGVGAATEYEAADTAAAIAKAAVAADQAAVNTAKLQVAFTTITSPLAGRVGELLVNKGNLVEANGANPLVVINQVSPIDVTFTLPEQQLPTVIAARRKGPLTVAADLRGGGPLAVGTLSFVDNAADPQTGTVQFKAAFANADQKLWPGLFVDVVLTLGERADSVVVPSPALQSGQNGQYVYVVADGKAERRAVVVAFEADGESVIASGLGGGETVVVEGQLRLAPGSRVDAKPYQRRAVTTTPVPTVVTGGAE